MFCVPACTSKVFAPKADPETDFEAKLIDGGKGVEITKYIGERATGQVLRNKHD